MKLKIQYILMLPMDYLYELCKLDENKKPFGPGNSTFLLMIRLGEEQFCQAIGALKLGQSTFDCLNDAWYSKYLKTSVLFSLA